VDCRFDLANDGWGREQYAAGHIPGAVYASLNDDLSAPRTGTNGRHPLPSQDALVATLQRLGIGNDTQVVVYDQDSGLYAGRLWWLLRYAGHRRGAARRRVRQVDRRRAAGRGRRRNAPALDLPAGVRPAMHVHGGRGGAPRRRRRTLLVDARGADRFEGRAETIDKVAGPHSGRTNRFYRSNLAPDGTMLSADALRAAFTELLGGRDPRDAVMYCGSGVSACHNLLAMEHAGLPAARSTRVVVRVVEPTRRGRSRRPGRRQPTSGR
jgi:thiosulfate/3-mercaptopyruvate sulfurtransferase